MTVDLQVLIPLLLSLSKYLPLQMNNVYTDVKWYAPQTKVLDTLSGSINDGENSETVFYL